MAVFGDLPIELIIDIIKQTVPHNEHEPILGVNAAWTKLQIYPQSLKYTNSSIRCESNKSPEKIAINSGLLALRW